MAWSGWVLWTCLLVAWGCNNNEHPGFVDSNPPPNPNGEDAEVQTGSTGSGSGNVGSGSFDPEQVYWVGSSRDVVAATGLTTPFAISRALEPTEVVYGLSSRRGGRFWGRKLAYADFDGLYEFVPDSDTTLAPESNDERIKTSHCDRAADSWTTSSDGRLFYTCPDKPDVWYENNTVVYERPFLGIGNGGRVLLLDGSLLSLGALGSADVTPVAGWLKEEFEILDYRGLEGGFRVVLEPLDTSARQLWSINADGEAEQLGVFPDVPEGFGEKTFALAGNDMLYLFGYLDGVGAIAELSVKGSSTIIHEDDEKFPVEVDGSEEGYIPLLTGP